MFSNKILLAVAVVLVAVVYLAIADLGVHAGRVHRGVSVGGIAVGGLTLPEAEDLLRRRGPAIRRSPLVFSAPGYDCRLVPGEVGWRARPERTARNAYDVGRSGGFWQMSRDRIRSWLGGVDVAWAGPPPPQQVDRFVRRCAVRGEGYGLEIDEDALRTGLLELMDTWPRDQVHPLPTV